jgi:farnesyl-diphosphate farnesyltransferase
VLDHLLQKTSRTFALTIPLLREPTRTEVGVAYLLFRVADTLEDATHWPRDRKVVELEDLARFLEGLPSGARSADASAGLELAARWTAEPPLDHAGYLELLGSFPEVVRAAGELSPDAWALVARHTARTCRGMASFVAREADGGGLRLRDVADLKAYCYAVAGIVGEMLTELFLLDGEELRAIAPDLRREAAAFGEALQLVNILKDAAADSVEGRTYLPPGVAREDVFALARGDLATAARYCTRLEGAGADGSLVAFTALPVLLAKATLDRVEAAGPGAKIGRAEVGAIVAELQEAVAARKVVGLLGRTVTAPRR